MPGLRGVRGRGQRGPPRRLLPFRTPGRSTANQCVTTRRPRRRAGDDPADDTARQARLGLHAEVHGVMGHGDRRTGTPPRDRLRPVLPDGGAPQRVAVWPRAARNAAHWPSARRGSRARRAARSAPERSSAGSSRESLATWLTDKAVLPGVMATSSAPSGRSRLPSSLLYITSIVKTCLVWTVPRPMAAVPATLPVCPHPGWPRRAAP